MELKAFGGDGKHKLPKSKLEPYRLWFEFLKLALMDPGIAVDRDVYAAWGDIEGHDFDDWWKKHWRQLFATPPSATAISTLYDVDASMTDVNSIVIRVSRTGRKTQALKEIDAILNVFWRDAPSQELNPIAPAYSLTVGRSMNLVSLRGMLKYLELYLQSGADMDAAALAYCDWADQWNEKIKTKKWKRNQIRVPSVITNFAREIRILNERRSQSFKRVKNSDEYNNARHVARHFLRSGQTILKNVAVGKFPGRF